MRAITIPVYVAGFAVMVVVACFAVVIVSRSLSPRLPENLTMSQIVHSSLINGSTVLVVITNLGKAPARLDIYLLTQTSVITNATCSARSELRGRITFTHENFIIYPDETVVIYCNVSSVTRVLVIPRV